MLKPENSVQTMTCSSEYFAKTFFEPEAVYSCDFSQPTGFALGLASIFVAQFCSISKTTIEEGWLDA